MKRNLAIGIICLLALGGCAGSQAEVATDLSVALDAASLAEGVYAARPTADPKTVAELARLLAAAQAAVTAWQSSTAPQDQAVASAAVAALVEYEASSGVVP